MILRQGNMWDAWDKADLFLITANSAIKDDGSLVMGAGIARQARDRFSGLDKALGARIQEICGNHGVYHLLISENWPKAKLGLFQTKRSPSYRSTTDIIEPGTMALKWWAALHHDKEIHLNYPGIGLGGMTKDIVYPIIKWLPDNVFIWENTNEVGNKG